MNKAYDRVEWDFLKAIMVRFGFERRSVDWTMECVKTVSYNLVINGKPSCRINPSRGLRQGDPLSPYLFLFVSDILSRMILVEVQAQNIRGMMINKNCPVLSHLFFTDDSLIFMEAKEQNYTKVIEIIKDYCEASGQKLNLEKSSLVFCENVKSEERRKVVEKLGVTR